MLTVSQIYTYPIKSLGGIALSSVEISERGFRHDRRWMLVDETNTFMTQREFPSMALLKVKFVENAMVIQNYSQENHYLEVPFEQEEAERIAVTIWSSRCRAQVVSKSANDWFSDFLQVKCRLVFMPDDSRRTVDTRYAQNKEITSFTDGYPFMMLGQASLDDLNNRMDVPLPIDRFRPNIVFINGEPYEEDLFEDFTIGTIAFSGAKLCARCTITTIDQQTANKGKEPLRTLSKYRMKNNNIYLGQNLLHRGAGIIHVGDQITVNKRRSK